MGQGYSIVQLPIKLHANILCFERKYQIMSKNVKKCSFLALWAVFRDFWGGALGGYGAPNAQIYRQTTNLNYIWLFRSRNALLLKEKTDFPTFWSFWAPLGPFRAPLNRFPAELNWGPVHFVFVNIPRARGKKNLEWISQNMIVLGQMVFFKLSGHPRGPLWSPSRTTTKSLYARVTPLFNFPSKYALTYYILKENTRKYPKM